MQALTAMTLAALGLAAATFAFDTASAGPMACSDKAVALYLEADEAYAEVVVEHIAKQAETCGAETIIAKTNIAGADLEKASRAFEKKGLKLVVLGEEPAEADAPSDPQPRIMMADGGARVHRVAYGR